MQSGNQSTAVNLVEGAVAKPLKRILGNLSIPEDFEEERIQENEVIREKVDLLSDDNKAKIAVLCQLLA